MVWGIWVLCYWKVPYEKTVGWREARKATWGQGQVFSAVGAVSHNLVIITLFSHYRTKPHDLNFPAPNNAIPKNSQ